MGAPHSVKKKIWEDKNRRNEVLSWVKLLDDMEGMIVLLEDEVRK